jgi:hypothetical protein
MTYIEFQIKYKAVLGRNFFCHCATCNVPVLSNCAGTTPAEVEELDTEWGTYLFGDDDYLTCLECGDLLETHVVPTDEDTLAMLEYHMAKGLPL